MALDRLTIDLDTYRVQKLITTLIKANYYLSQQVTALKVTVSAGRKGFHVVFYLGTTLEKQEKLKLRQVLNDDYNRIDIDEQKNSNYDFATLFSKKVSYLKNGKMVYGVSVGVWYFEDIREALSVL